MDERRIATSDRRHAERQAPPSERRVIIERVNPQVDGGRFSPKRVVGDFVVVTAHIFADGHDVLRAALMSRLACTGRPATSSTSPGESQAPGSTGLPDAWPESEMHVATAGLDLWQGTFPVRMAGPHEFRIVAWVDRFETWRRELRIKAAAAQSVTVPLLEGALLLREAAERIRTTRADGDAVKQAEAAAHRQWLLLQADSLSDMDADVDRLTAALSPELRNVMRRHNDRSQATMSPWWPLWVDRPRARFGAWYEFFPRSASPTQARGGTFQDACAWLPRIADLGFDVVYLPPIHPIGHLFRKGRNNSLISAPDDPGSPWAIGSRAGGHDAVDPGLGTLDDFDAFRATAERLGLEVALDLAWQCSPDHPWVREHAEWFRHRPDGTIAYAENPPKRYQDIYPLDFACPDWRELWRALLDVTRFWIDRGVRAFRVDNPHTKSLRFWEWLIHEVQSRDPNVIFLSEAFTRPSVKQYLAKAGFSQSYTYFTWRTTQAELTDYLTELTQSEVAEYLRPNLFANTPDILHAYLQHGGRPAFEARLVLAATLSASYGIYSGFELCEAQAVPGTEEYQDSEKYQHRPWDWDRPGHIQELVCRVNQVRRSQPALQRNDTLRFHRTDNSSIIAFSKAASEDGGRPGDSVVLTIVNLDPHHMQHGHVQVPLARFGQPSHEGFGARDLLTDAVYRWHGEWNYVRLDPGLRQAHILELRRT